MADSAPQPEQVTNRDRARTLILKDLGVKKVASWCGVEEDTVYQWLSRGTDDKPIPPARIPAILAGAKAAGLQAPLAVLWPEAGGAL